MKKLLLIAVSVLASCLGASGQITTGTGSQTVVIAPATGYVGTPYTIKLRRDVSKYPLTSQGFKDFAAAVATGTFQYTVVSTGCVVAAGTVPPLTAPTCTQAIPNWLTQLQYSQTSSVLTVRAAGVSQIAFNTNPKTTWSSVNPGGVTISNDVFYGPAPLDPATNNGYTGEWQITKGAGAYTLSLKNSSGTAYDYNFSSTSGASNVQLIGTTTSPPTSTTAASSSVAGDPRTLVGTRSGFNVYSGPGLNYLLEVFSNSPDQFAPRGSNLSGLSLSGSIPSAVVATNNSGFSAPSDFVKPTGYRLRYFPDGAKFYEKSTLADETAPGSSTTTTPPSSTTSTGANGIPLFETFNYQPITSNPDSWDGYDSRVNQDGPIGKYATLTNGQITVRVMGDQGGTPSFIASNSDNLNRINLHDLGTQNGQTLYRDGATSPYPNPIISPDWPNIGNDPIQMGNVFGQKSEVVAMGRTADMIYTKTHMRNWSVKDEYTDVYLEQWVTLDGIGAPVYTKITFNRTDDKSFQAFRAHEFPTFYSVGSMRTLAYIGENGGINYTANQAGQFDISIAKNWIALAKSASPSAPAIGLTAPGLYFTTQWQHAIGDSKPAPNEDLGNEKGYSAWRAFFHTDWNQVFYSKHTWVVGTVQQIKDYAEAKTDPRNKIAWKFNSRNGRGFWVHKNGIDEGFPTNNDGIEITKQGSGEFYIQAPYMAIPASSVSNIYLRYKSTGFSGSWSLNYNKVNQQDGAALNNGQTINFNTINDNQWHTVTIPVNGQWQNTIQKLRFSNDGAASGSKIKIDWINTVNADPSL
ncbi:hypothetical protein [Spirosoma aerophilum]